MSDEPTNSTIRDEILRAIQGQHALIRHELAKSYEDVAEDDNVSNDTSLTVSPQSQNPERITRIVAYVGTGKGRLTLGNRTILINSTVQPVTLEGRWRLENTDKRKLECVTLDADGKPTGAGNPTFLYLGLFGEEIPRAELW